MPAPPVGYAGEVTLPDGSVLELAAVTDQGPVRRENQDRWAVLPLAGAVALLVADGMGGHADGGLAAELAVGAVARQLEAASQPDAALAVAVAAANDAIADRSESAGALGMGTTLVAAVVRDRSAQLINVGDSRAYRIRDAVAEPVTSDHSWVAEEIAAGRLPARALRQDPRRSVITRALMGSPVAGDEYRLRLAPDDVLLLCSDGLWEPLEDDQLGRLLGARRGRLADDLARVCSAAIDAGGTDNVTGVACRLRESDVG
ncbi:MAG: serine/threonine-protein phosphatase [Chloroflexi bacterium]|nr:MAG: serine/threonine-protein phosphatase [Chloroflexota bacterium]